MGIILFFMVLSAWCAEEFFDIPSCWPRSLHGAMQEMNLSHANEPIPGLKNLSIGRDSEEFFDIPSCWTRSLHGARPVQNMNLLCTIPGLQNLIICRDSHVETMLILTDEGPLWLTMDFRLPSLYQGGNLFLVNAACKKCSLGEKGEVTFTPLDAHNARFMVVEPKKDPDVTFVCFSTTGGRSPKDVCEYDAKEKSFTVRRFFYEYYDLSRAFVSAEVTYENPHDVVIEWGLRAADGTVSIDDQSPKKFHFALCQPGQCLRKAD